MSRKVSILGEEYDIITMSRKDTPKLNDAYGYIEPYTKQIVIDADIERDADERTIDRADLFVNKVVRHEIVHAFFAESGLKSNSPYADNEELVDWIAIQFPKMAKVFKELEVEE